MAATYWLERRLLVECRQRRGGRRRVMVLLLDHGMHGGDVLFQCLKSRQRLVALRTLEEAIRLGGVTLIIFR